MPNMREKKALSMSRDFEIEWARGNMLEGRSGRLSNLIC